MPSSATGIPETIVKSSPSTIELMPCSAQFTRPPLRATFQVNIVIFRPSDDLIAKGGSVCR